MFETPPVLEPASDEEVEEAMCVILAAYGQKFPQLRGKAVRPDLRDVQRKVFARELITHLQQYRIRFFRERAAVEDQAHGEGRL